MSEAMIACRHASEQIEAVERRGIETYVPDKLLAKELAGAERVTMNGRQRRRARLGSPGVN